MSVNPLRVIPISQFRSHTKFCLHRVAHHGEHLKLTYRGTGRAAVIPMQDALVLWQLQSRPLKMLDDRLAQTHEAWTRAKSFLEAFEASEIDGKSWRHWSGFRNL